MGYYSLTWGYKKILPVVFITIILLVSIVSSIAVAEPIDSGEKLIAELPSGTVPNLIDSEVTLTNTSHYIEGNIIITDTGEPIIFTSNNTGSESPGDWGMIEFNATGDGNIDYCNISYATLAINVSPGHDLTFTNNSITNTTFAKPARLAS